MLIFLLVVIAALYLSRPGGSNKLNLRKPGGVTLGWQSIEAMLDRELQRKRMTSYQEFLV